MSTIGNHLNSALGIVQGAKSKIISVVIDKAGDGIEGIRDKVVDIKDEVKDQIGNVKDAAVDIATNPLTDTTGSLEDKLSPQRYQDIKDIFGDSIRYDEVIVNDSSLLAEANGNFNNSSRPFVIGNVINSDGVIDDRTFIHEMVHIYQYNKYGWSYLPAAGIEVARGNYNYDYSDLERIAKDNDFDGNKFEQFGLEEQAEIVADYYELTKYQAGDGDLTLNGSEEIVNESNIDKVMKIYKPYIEEIQDTEPRDGWRKETDERTEEVLREVGEGGEEVLGEAKEGVREISQEIKEGDIPGAIYETGEAAVETTYETGEAFIETGYEYAEGAVETSIEGAKEIPGAIEDVIDKVKPWDGLIPG